ncbi:hypothetical protein PFISCL1PPCAC_20514 [Pristionchus fissidentatus]|uniref:HTH La-type RNA-binding domain-containing protein n=1 Tax=Pristionchus fissidentatus TaxID=1538716 RepID=A0AAV5WH01_9BILA|nr:hypothetical protein PFISCL1PPCAC_20514 [Pristionchus fissidentatus]
MMDLDHDSFYVCQETFPRCYVVQKGIQVDRSQIARVKKEQEEGRMDTSGGVPGVNMAEGDGTTKLVFPPFPTWYNEECRRELMMAGDASIDGEDAPKSLSSDIAIREYDTPVGGHVTCHLDTATRHENMKLQLKAQLEYYFSRENLAHDRYLKCQMDADGFVAISTIAGFRKVSNLTSNLDLILHTLRESRKVEVDDAGERVRPISQRCTIILREMGEKTEEEIKELLAGGPSYKSLRTYGNNDEWYVVYNNEETTKNAYLHIQQLKPSICARIKSGPPPDQQLYVQPPPDDVASVGDEGPTPIFDLGKLLATMGYTPRATYRPGTTLVQVVESMPPNLAPSPAPSPIPDYSLMNGTLMHYGNGGGYRRGPIHRGSGGGGGHGAAASSQNRTTRGANGGREGGGVSSQSRSNGVRGAPMNGGSLTVVTGKQIRGGDRSWSGRNGVGSSNGGGIGTAFHSGGGGGFNASWGSTSNAAMQMTTTTMNSSIRLDGSGTTSTAASTVNGSSANTTHSPEILDQRPFNYEEVSFPSLVDPKPEPEPVVAKLSFSSVAAGRKEEKKEKRKSFAQCLKP